MSLPLIANNRTVVGLHVGAWALMVLFFLGFLTTQMPVWEVVVLMLGNFGLLAVLFYSHTWLVNRYWEKGDFRAFFPIALCIFGLVCTFRYLVNIWILKKYLIREGVLIFSPAQRMAAFVIITSFVFAAVAVVFQLIINRYQREKQHLALMAEQQAAELQFLKAQINPHFLFNALHNLYSLTVVKSDLAPAMLLKLSGLLRYVIYDSRHAEVPIEREISEIRQFIDLFAMRSPEPPAIDLDINGVVDGCTIEPMLLIPLVENCFKHADFDTNPKAFCQIQFDFSQSGRISFVTRNSFNPADQQKDRVGGVGLENMQRRLGLRYPGRHRFVFGERDGVFEVRLEIEG